MKNVLLLVLFMAVFAGCDTKNDTDTKADPMVASANETKATPPAEFADAKYAEIGKKGIAAMSAGDIDSWMSGYADNAVYVWNSGDSLNGKAAIADYWKKRRADVIETITFSNDIWMPIKVNTPQSLEAPGIWLLGWYQVDAKYKNGNTMNQWTHIDMHFNAEDKIDRVIQYIDRVPINAAMPK